MPVSPAATGSSSELGRAWVQSGADEARMMGEPLPRALSCSDGTVAHDVRLVAALGALSAGAVALGACAVWGNLPVPHSHGTVGPSLTRSPPRTDDAELLALAVEQKHGPERGSTF